MCGRQEISLGPVVVEDGDGAVVSFSDDLRKVAFQLGDADCLVAVDGVHGLGCVVINV